jgi:hypothetical protein
MEHSNEVPLIQWSEEPVFELVNSDRNFNSFVCSKPGSVRLKGVGVIEFHVGWPTDVTSSPWYVQWLIPQLGPHAPAAVLHDRLIGLGFPTAVARKWMHLQLKQLPKVKWWRRMAMVTGVWLWNLMGRSTH